MNVRVDRVSMDYPGVRALSDVTMELRTGEIRAIIGENGAGKSTLLKILSGIQQPTAGRLLIDEVVVKFSGVKDAEHRGIAMVHQELNLIDTLSVAENISLGSEPHRLGLLQRHVMQTKAKETLKRLKCDISPTTTVGELPLASKQLVEIAKALAQRAKILILDEPTAVLAERETRDLLDLLKSLKDEGVGVIYVSHRLDEVCEIADHVTVLRDGVVVAEIPREQGLSSLDLANRMVGRELQDLYPPKLKDHSGTPVLTLNRARFDGFPGPLDLQVREGEIVGLGGLIGSGRTEVAQGIIRKRKLLDGQVIAEAPAYVSEDRKGTGLHLSLNLTTNTVMANLKHYGGLTLDKHREKQAANVWIKKLGIRAKHPGVTVQSLSGGNQQKVSLAKWLETQPRLLVLDEPTRGVDVGAKSEIYQLITDMAKSGLGCLVISSEMNELIGLCDRVIVMRERKIAGELEGDQVTEANMMALAAGVEVEAVS